MLVRQVRPMESDIMPNEAVPVQVTLICTILNEAKSLPSFLASLKKLARLPDEVVVCDGGSTDETLRVLEEAALQFPCPFKVIQVSGNRSVGRNAAIRQASHDWIACTDAGCELDPNWLAQLLKPVEEGGQVDVVSGLYEAKGKTQFERCAGVITLSTQGINPATFLPSTRSVAFRKSAWARVGGFPEDLSHNEDSAFGLALRQAGCRFTFAPDAFVFWRPRGSIRQTFRQFYRYSYGDAEAQIFLFKYIRIYLRYIVWFLLSVAVIAKPSVFFLWSAAVVPYWMFWAIRGWQQCRDWRAIGLVPLVKFVVDIANMAGYLQGRNPRLKS